MCAYPTNRPFRHLCPEADMRDAMTDEEFWRHVFPQPPTWDYDDEGPDMDDTGYPDPCSECGEVGACAYDSEGRPLIHPVTNDDVSA